MFGIRVAAAVFAAGTLATSCSSTGNLPGLGSKVSRPTALPTATSADDVANTIDQTVKIAAQQARGVSEKDRAPRITETYDFACHVKVAATSCPAPDGVVTIYVNPREAWQKYLMSASSGGGPVGIQNSALTVYAEYLTHRMVQRRGDLQNITDLGDSRVLIVAGLARCASGQIYAGLDGLMDAGLRQKWLPAATDRYRASFEKGARGEKC